MPNPGTIAHSRNGSFEWDGQGWIPRPDVPNPMAGDTVAANAQAQAEASAHPLSTFFKTVGSDIAQAPSDLLNTIRHKDDSLDPTKPPVPNPALAEAWEHPSEILPAFKAGVTDPVIGGHAVSGLLGLLAGGRAGDVAQELVPSARTVASGVNAAAEVVPKSILGTDLPVKDILRSAASKIDTPPAAGYDRFMPNTSIPPKPPANIDFGGYSEGANPRLLSTLPERLARVKAAAGMPDLMDQFQSASDTGVGSGKQEFDMDGVHYAPDESGSHVAQVATPDPREADVPDFTFEGQNLNGEPPAFGSGPEGYSPRVVTPIADALPGQGGIDPEALDRLRRAIDPKIMQDWYDKNPGGMRTNRMSSTP